MRFRKKVVCGGKCIPLKTFIDLNLYIGQSLFIHKVCKYFSHVKCIRIRKVSEIWLQMGVNLTQILAPVCAPNYVYIFPCP